MFIKSVKSARTNADIDWMLCHSPSYQALRQVRRKHICVNIRQSKQLHKAKVYEARKSQ